MHLLKALDVVQLAHTHESPESEGGALLGDEPRQFWRLLHEQPRLAALLAAEHLDVHAQFSVPPFTLLLKLQSQFLGVHGLHDHKVRYFKQLLDLIALKVPNKVPSYVIWEGLVLRKQVIDIVLTKGPLPRIVGLLNLLGWLCLRSSQEICAAVGLSS